MSKDDWDAVRRDRLVKNELAFRDYNNRRIGIEEQANPNEAQVEQEVVPIACECGNADCITALSVTVNEYINAHSAPTDSPSNPATTTQTSNT